MMLLLNNHTYILLIYMCVKAGKLTIVNLVASNITYIKIILIKLKN